MLAVKNIVDVFIGVIVCFTTFFKLYSCFTLIGAVLVRTNFHWCCFRKILSYACVWIAVSAFNKKIECVFVFIGIKQRSLKKTTP